MTPLYVCGPYAGADLAEIQRNVLRAIAVGRLAVERGYAPIVPHAAGWLGMHGPGQDGDQPSPQRESALRSGVALARFVGLARGPLWVILRDDGTPSEGCMLEIDAWLTGYCEATHLSRIPPRATAQRPWEEWRMALVDAGVDEVGEL